MARKAFSIIVPVLLGMCALLLGGCAKIDKQVDAVAEWADQDPVFSDLTVQQQLAGGIPTKQIQLLGELNVDSASELIEALSKLHAKQTEMQDQGIDSFNLALKAQLGATRFFWDGQLPEPAVLEEQEAAYELLADPAIGIVHVFAGDHGTRVKVQPAENADDSRTIRIRDTLFRTLDAADTGIDLEFHGMPLTPGGDPTTLALGNFPVGYTEALAFVKRVDAAAPGFQVQQATSNTLWQLYTDNDYDEADLRRLKEILSEPEAGESPSVIIDGPEGRLGWAFVGMPLEEQPEDSSEWSPRMQELFASDA
ncbi:hypothetical protein [Corynebacterium sp. 20_84]